MRYIVALQVGGVMEQPEYTYQNYQEIEASSPREAERIYNEKNNCSYYYGKCIGSSSQAKDKLLQEALRK